MRLVRKISRKRYFNKGIYEYERLMVPLPSESNGFARPWLGRDLEVFVEPIAVGFAVLVVDKDAGADKWLLSMKLKKAVKDLHQSKKIKS